MEKILILILIFNLLYTISYGQDNNASRQDLVRLEQEAKQKEAELKKYQQQETKLQREVQNLSKQGKQTEQLAQKLIKDIETLKGKTFSTEEQKKQLEQTLELWQALVATEAHYYTLENALNNSFYDTTELEKLLIIKALLLSHTNFLDQLDNQTRLSLKELKELEEKNKLLELKHQDALSQQEKLAKNYEKKKQDLKTAHQL